MISASRRCDGKISEPSNASDTGGETEVDCNDEGLVSDSMIDGEIGSLILVVVGTEGRLDDFGVVDIARDMRRTSRGRMCFPSDLV